LAAFLSVEEAEEMEESDVKSVSPPHVFKPYTNNADNENEWRQVTDLLPILLSVACYHLADGAIAEYLVSKDEKA
jgi:hypothetical protein